MYPFERFTMAGKAALTLAQEEAERAHHSYIGTEDLVLGILRERDGLGGRVLRGMGADLEGMRAAIESVLGRNERVILQQIIPTSRVKKVIEIAFQEAKRMNDTGVGTEHLVLGLLIDGEGVAAHVLEELGIEVGSVRNRIASARAAPRTAGGGPPASAPTAHPSGEHLLLRRRGPLGGGLSAEAASAVALAEEECLRLGSLAVGTEHLVLGVLRQSLGAGAQALGAFGVELQPARDAVAGRDPAPEHPLSLAWTREAEAALELARATPPATTARLLSACLAGTSTGASKLLEAIGADPARLRATLDRDAGGSQSGAPSPG